MADTCEPLAGKFPWPPQNVMAMSTLNATSDSDLRWDDPADYDAGSEDVYAQTAAPTRAATVVLVNGTPTIAASAIGTLTVVSAPVPAGTTVEIDSLVLTCTHAPIPGKDEFSGAGADANAVAASLAAALNTGSAGASGWGIVAAVAGASTVALTASEPGAAGNSISLVSSSPLIVPSAGTLTGGTDLAQLVLGGKTFSGVSSSRTFGGMDFDVRDAGRSLTEAINDPKNSVSSFLQARWSGTGLYFTSVIEGVQGNGISVSSNSEALVCTTSETSGGRGDPCPPGKTNIRWNILGVNVYRSDSGERGPYLRVNRVPVGSLFYRDRTDIVEVPREIIPWDGGWVWKGDSPNSKAWRLKTRYTPLVKRDSSTPASAPTDVEVWVDGTRAPVLAVFGRDGWVDLSRERVWDVSTEKFQDPPTPTVSSTVEVRYSYQRGQKLVNTLDERTKVFYRVASVAQDPTGTAPSGLVETPLEYCAPVSPLESEQLDYIWREAVRRNQWILDQGGERVKLFLRRVCGNRCRCVWSSELQEFSKQPMNACLVCYGTGWVGGYEGPYNIIIGPEDADRRVTQTPNGRRLESSYEVWIGPSPSVSQRDFIVKQDGERFSIGPVHRPAVRGRSLQQSFQIAYLDSGDIRYKVPMSVGERLPWSQAMPDCDPVPYPVGPESETGLVTDKEGVPDGREVRGRTPVYQNLTYGGRGGR